MQGAETAFWMSAASNFTFEICDHMDSTELCSIHTFTDWMFVSGAQYLQIIRHCPISHLSLLYVCGKWTFMYCIGASKRHTSLSAAVLQFQSSHTHTLHIL